jgi:corticotropin releasing hormone receptor 1/corticotropin releasing hormone receptor 2
MELVAVPGFGFLPRDSYNIIDAAFQEYLSAHDISASDIPADYADDIKCNLVLIPHWQELFPHLVKKDTCPPKWDNASCIPPTLAGETAVFPCMAVYDGRTYSPYYNASRDCSSGGVWAPTTDYNDCMCNSTEDCSTEVHGALEISIVIYLVGYVLSFLALCGAIGIFLSLREMRCLRHKIHLGLFSAFGLSALNWIVTKSLPELAQHLLSVFDSVYCTSWVITFFFHLACFYWMFLEGFYLFLQVQFPLSLVSIKYSHFLLFGCGETSTALLISS